MKIFDDKPQAVYAFPSDTLRKHNLLEQPGYQADSVSFRFWQAFVQVYNRSMIDNKMTAESVMKLQKN
jgi:hypothetical protein